jgi:uncharacterized protein YegJ (DUF2314 family)
MRRKPRTLPGLLLLAAALITPLQAQAQVVGDRSADAVLAEAVARARATLPLFWERLESPSRNEENFAVRLRYATASGGTEDLWAVDVEREGDSVAATIDGAPRDVPDLAHGQRVKAPLSRLVDWYFFRDGRMHGGQTIRAMLPVLSKRERDKFEAMLAPQDTR